MEKRIPKFEEICGRYGLEIDKRFLKAYAMNAKGFLAGKNIDQEEYVEYILEMVLLDKLIISQTTNLIWPGKIPGKNIPEWLKQGISFEYKELNLLEADYGSYWEFEESVWEKYLEKDGFDALFSAQELKRCRLLEKFSMENAEKYVRKRVIEILKEVVDGLNQTYRFSDMLAELKQEIGAGYKEAKTNT